MQLLLSLDTLLRLAFLLGLRKVRLLIVRQLLQLHFLLEHLGALTAGRFLTVPISLLLLLEQLAVSGYHPLVHLLGHVLLDETALAQILSLFIEHVEDFALFGLLLGCLGLFLFHCFKVLQPCQYRPLVHLISVDPNVGGAAAAHRH